MEITSLLVYIFLIVWGELEKDLRVMIGRFAEVCQIWANESKRKV